MIVVHAGDGGETSQIALVYKRDEAKCHLLCSDGVIMASGFVNVCQTDKSIFLMT